MFISVSRPQKRHSNNSNDTNTEAKPNKMLFKFCYKSVNIQNTVDSLHWGPSPRNCRQVKAENCVLPVHDNRGQRFGGQKKQAFENGLKSASKRYRYHFRENNRRDFVNSDVIRTRITSSLQWRLTRRDIHLLYLDKYFLILFLPFASNLFGMLCTMWWENWVYL